MHFVYILYSLSIDTYYVGETENIEFRLKQHNLGFYVGAYTKQATDWRPYISIECETRSEARKIEAHIKRMKNRNYIENLKQHPEIIDKLKERYKQRSQSR